MTNERSAGLIRRHLLATADERPADGQLEAILAETAVRRQRPRWTLPVLGLADRTARWSSVSLRWAAVAMLLLAALVGYALAGGAKPAVPATPFQGTWSMIDEGDGSLMTVVIGPGNAPTVHFEDAFSMSCAAHGDDDTVFIIDSTGVIEGQRLTIHSGEGGCTTWRIPPSDGWYDYNPDEDTLLDAGGGVWEPGLPDSSFDPATFAARFEGDWTSIDPGDGSMQTLVIGPGSTPSVHFEDEMSSSCRDNGDASVHFVWDGAGEAHGWLLVVEVGEGGCQTWRVPPTQEQYIYNGVDDTLTDTAGLVWSRSP